MSRFIFLITMVLSVAASAQHNTRQGFDKLLYINEKDTLPYRLLRPENLQAKNKFPLVIFLHGAGERGNDNEVHIKHIASLFLDPQKRKQFPCFVLAPQCPTQIMWAAHDRDGSRLVMRKKPTVPMTMVIELIEKIESEFPIDASRIYVTGLSMGGYGTWDLIARFPDRFAAAVPICGGGDPATAPSVSHLPLWAFHGALDRVVVPRLSRVMIRALQDAGGVPGYTEYPDVGHNSWDNAYTDPYLLPWMFDQYLGKESKNK
jgi:predicted peptidase